VLTFVYSLHWQRSLVRTDFTATLIVIAGLDPAIRSLMVIAVPRRDWIAGSSPAMTVARGRGNQARRVLPPSLTEK
jgi:hypothetical protein